MTKFLRLAAGILCVGVLALGVVVIDPAWLSNFPHRRGPDNKASLAEEIARNEQLDQQEAALHRQRQAKRRVAAEVIARQCSLAEAIEQFRALDRVWPELPPPPRSPRSWGCRGMNGAAGTFSISSGSFWPIAPTRRPRSPADWKRNSNNSWPTARSTSPRRRSRVPSGVVNAKNGVSVIGGFDFFPSHAPPAWPCPSYPSLRRAGPSAPALRSGGLYLAVEG